MTMIAPQEAVAAAMISTQTYLEFLEAQPSRRPEISVDHLKEQHVPAHIEGRRYHRYAARLPSGLKLRPDAHALFTPQGDGHAPIPVRVLDYNARTGMAKLAFQEAMTEEAGHLRIEHRQALRRWLAWLERCGGEVATPEEIEIPSIFLERALKEARREEDFVTPAQFAAIETILTSPLSFIQGPPGSGKTSVVLARTAQVLAAQGRHVLVTAWRDETVDEALTALILDGVPEDQILRLGVPTAPFLHAYPRCCEIHSGEQELTRLTGRLRRLRSDLSAIEKLHELTIQVEEEKRQLQEFNRTLTEKDRVFRDLSEQVRRLDLKARGLHNELFRSKSKLTGERRKRSELHMPEIERNKQTLNSETEFITQTVKSLRQELASLGGLGSLLTTGRKKAIESQIADHERRLEEIKKRMEELDYRKDLRKDTYKDLTGHIYDDESISGSMHIKLDRLRDRLSELRPRLEKAEKEWNECRLKIKPAAEKLRESTQQLDALRQGQVSPEMEATMARRQEMEDEAVRLEKRIAEFQLDVEKCPIIGLTLDALIGFSARDLIDADWIFVDEAHCTPIVKLLPLLTLRRPIAMLGDTQQMPPFCAKDDDPVVRAWWAKPALFLEDAFRCGQDFETLLQLDEPQQELTRTVALEQSFVIGPGQAELLERYIFEKPLAGSGATDLPIHLRHCEPWIDAWPQPGINESEAEETVGVVDYLIRTYGSPETPPSLAILTPGEAQADFIREKLRRRDERLPDIVDVLAAHRALGLTWDHVIFSVTSTKRLGDASVPPESLCSAKVEGRSLLHTVLTRARKQLILLMDRSDWASNDPPCLLTELARTVPFFEMSE